jgi:hypothetical protein
MILAVDGVLNDAIKMYNFVYHVDVSKDYCLALKMKALISFDMYQSTQSYIPEGLNLQQQR